MEAKLDRVQPEYQLPPKSSPVQTTDQDWNLVRQALEREIGEYKENNIKLSEEREEMIKEIARIGEELTNIKAQFEKEKEESQTYRQSLETKLKIGEQKLAMAKKKLTQAEENLNQEKQKGNTEQPAVLTENQPQQIRNEDNGQLEVQKLKNEIEEMKKNHETELNNLKVRVNFFEQAQVSHREEKMQLMSSVSSLTERLSQAVSEKDLLLQKLPQESSSSIEIRRQEEIGDDSEAKEMKDQIERLKSDLEAKTLNISSLSALIEGLKKEHIDEKEEIRNQIEKEKQELSDKLANQIEVLRKEITILEESNEEKRIEIERSGGERTRLQDLEALMDAQKIKSVSLEEKLKEAESLNQNLQSRIDEKVSEIVSVEEKANQEINRLKDELGQSRFKVEGLDKSLQEINSKFNLLESKNSETEIAMKNTQQSLEKQIAENNELKESHANEISLEVQKAAQASDQIITELRNETVRLEGSLKFLQDEKQNLTNELRGSIETLSCIKKEADTLKANFDESKETIERLNSLVKTQQNEIRKREETLFETENTLRVVQEHLNDREADNRLMISQINQLEVSLGKKSEEFKKKENEAVEILKGTLKEKEEANSNLNGELKKLKAKVKILELKEITAGNSNEERSQEKVLRDQIEGFKKIIEGVEIQKAEYNMKLNQEEKSKKDLEKKVSVRDNTIRVLKEETVELKNQILNLNKEISRNEKKIAKSTKSISENRNSQENLDNEEVQIPQIDVQTGSLKQDQEVAFVEREDQNRIGTATRRGNNKSKTTGERSLESAKKDHFSIENDNISDQIEKKKANDKIAQLKSLVERKNEQLRLLVSQLSKFKESIQYLKRDIIECRHQTKNFEKDTEFAKNAEFIKLLSFHLENFVQKKVVSSSKSEILKSSYKTKKITDDILLKDIETQFSFEELVRAVEEKRTTVNEELSNNLLLHNLNQNWNKPSGILVDEEMNPIPTTGTGEKVPEELEMTTNKKKITKAIEGSKPKVVISRRTKAAQQKRNTKNSASRMITQRPRETGVSKDFLGKRSGSEFRKLADEFNEVNVKKTVTVGLESQRNISNLTDGDLNITRILSNKKEGSRPISQSGKKRRSPSPIQREERVQTPKRERKGGKLSLKK